MKNGEIIAGARFSRGESGMVKTYKPQMRLTLQSNTDPRLAQLSERIDKSHAALNKKLDELYRLREVSSGEQWRHYEEQIRALKEQEIRLLKSKNTAWMAHWLRRDGEVEIVERPHRTLGLSLIAISAAGLALLGYLAWKLNSGA